MKLGQVTQSLAQLSFKNFKDQDLPISSGQPVLVFDHSSDDFFPCAQREFSILRFAALACCPFTAHAQEECELFEL